MEGKEKRVEEKEVEKMEKGKSGFGKSPFCFFFSQSNFVGLCLSPSWQRAIDPVSKERGGDYRAMASSQGVLSEG